MRFTLLSKITLSISALLMIAGVALFVTPGPILSIEFTGGTLMEVRLEEGKTREDLTMQLRSFTEKDLEGASVTRAQGGTFFVKTPDLSNEEHLALAAHLEEALGNIEELQFTTIGPTVGSALKNRAMWAFLIANIAILLYLAIVFRKLPSYLSPWSFGAAAITALVHDVLILVGIFTILSYYTTFQMDTLFVSAILSVIGYSVNDTIVIFDRIRDNMQTEGRKYTFAELAVQSLKQSISRTINTGISSLIMLIALLFLGAESIRWFILTLTLGIIIGTYSSFFVATPIVVFWQQARAKKK